MDLAQEKVLSSYFFLKLNGVLQKIGMVDSWSPKELFEAANCIEKLLVIYLLKSLMLLY